MKNIQSSCLGFLNQIRENNNREWFEENKKWFEQEKKSIKLFFESIFEALNNFDRISSYKMFRIYRDVRFSADKTPYKTHFSAHFVREGKNRRGGYYFHIEPGNSFIAGGFFAPEKDDLLRIRQEFETDDSEIRQILSDKKLGFRFNWEGDEVKTAPKGFDKNHSAIDLIKKKQFIFRCRYSDKEVLSEEFQQKVVSDFRLLLPFLDYMTEVLITDLNGEKLI